MQVINQNFIAKLFGFKSCKFAVKALHDQIIDTGRSQQLDFFPKACQPGWRLLWCKQLARMRFESKHCGWQATRLGFSAQLAQQSLMAEVQPVKIADCQNTGREVGAGSAADHAHQ